MLRRSILTGTVALTALLAVSALSTTPASAQGAWVCPAAEKGKKNPVAKSDAAVADFKKASMRVWRKSRPTRPMVSH